MKKSLILYIALVVIGLIGLFIVTKEDSHTVADENIVLPVKEVETVSIAIAKIDLAAGKILTPEDYRIETREFTKGSGEVAQFAVTQHSLEGYAINAELKKDSLLPVHVLVIPGSESFLAMALRPGGLLYTIEIPSEDNYLIDNIKAGSSIDVYLAYSKVSQGESNAIFMSPSDSLGKTRLKPLMKDRRVLAVKEVKRIEKDGIEITGNGNRLVIEIFDNDLKLLKGLEGKSKLVILPTPVSKNSAEVKSALNDSEASWPISESVIFDTDEEQALEKKVNELRG